MKIKKNRYGGEYYYIDGNKVREGTSVNGNNVRYTIDGNKIYLGDTTYGEPMYLIEW